MVPATSGDGILGDEPMSLVHATPGYLLKAKVQLRSYPACNVYVRH